MLLVDYSWLILVDAEKAAEREPPVTVWMGTMTVDMCRWARCLNELRKVESVCGTECVALRKSLWRAHREDLAQARTKDFQEITSCSKASTSLVSIIIEKR